MKEEWEVDAVFDKALSYSHRLFLKGRDCFEPVLLEVLAEEDEEEERSCLLFCPEFLFGLLRKDCRLCRLSEGAVSGFEITDGAGGGAC